MIRRRCPVDRYRANPIVDELRLDYAHDREDGLGPDELEVVFVDGEHVRHHVDVDG